jgi:hypothetical protein
MQISVQNWKEKNLLPLVNNEVDLVVINDVPTCQVEIYNFISAHYKICPQDPLNQIFVSIKNNPQNDKEDLRSETELAWHIDGMYKQKPYNITGLYCVDIDGRADTKFVDNRIIDQIPHFYDKCKDDLAVIDMEKLTDDKRYPYKFKDEREKKLFRRFHKSVRHQLFQEDKRGKYIYYSNSSSTLEDSEMIDNILYSNDRIYSHEWKKKQLVLCNNVTTNHKRNANNSKSRHMWKVCAWNLNS